MLIQEEFARLQARAATKRYHTHFDNDAYHRAVEGKSVAYANALTDEALALCGHPYYKLSRRHWARPAQSFLRLFRRALDETYKENR